MSIAIYYKTKMDLIKLEQEKLGLIILDFLDNSNLACLFITNLISKWIILITLIYI